MATDTDIRLRSALDAHPAGGPDGGRDIESVFSGDHIAYGAVGFQNGANDSPEQNRKIRAKYSDDLGAAIKAKPDLKAFVFFTNIHLTMGEQAEMKEEARKCGVEHCDILDRERLRIELDSPGGFFIRFQYLAIPLSEAEQASFLARYGDRIQEVVSTGFQRLERTLNRILFLNEASDVLSAIYVRFQLKRSYPAIDIGHFRAFVNVSLREIKHDIFMVWFGSSDKSTRFMQEAYKSHGEPAGIAHGISSGQWERQVKLPKPGDAESASDSGHAASSQAVEQETDEGEEEEKRALVQVGGGSSIGMDPVPFVVARYTHDDSLVRFRPRLQLRDLDDCMFMPVLNRSLAEKLHSIQVFANGYKLADIGPENFLLDGSPYESAVPTFEAQELTDPWVRIRPAGGSSAFSLRFTEVTPRRMYGYEETRDTPAPKPG